MIPISSHLNNLPNQAINKIMWLSYLKSYKKCCLMIPISSYLNNLPNQAINKIMWLSYLKLDKKCSLMISISSYLNNLPNQAIYEVMWPSYLKSHEKMLPNDTHIILFEQPTQSGNILSHVTTTLRHDLPNWASHPAMHWFCSYLPNASTTPQKCALDYFGNHFGWIWGKRSRVL
jgi:hypothetical protein